MIPLWKLSAAPLPWSAPASFSIGYPSAGDAVTRARPTRIGGYWFEAYTDEFRKVIEGAGLVYDPTDTFQFLNAIQILLGVDVTPGPPPPPPPPGPPPPPPPITADFSASPVFGAAPLAVAFSDATSGSPTAWSWLFGDGGSSAVQDPVYTYTAAGTYSVSLSATVGGIPYGVTKTDLVIVTPQITNYELREDGSRELREDGSFELRE